MPRVLFTALGQVLRGEQAYNYGRIQGQGGLNFLIDNDMDLDAALGCSLEHVVDTVLLILRRRSA